MKSKKNAVDRQWKGTDSGVISDIYDVSQVTIPRIFHKFKNSILRGVSKIKIMKQEKDSTDSVQGKSGKFFPIFCFIGVFSFLLQDR